MTSTNSSSVGLDTNSTQGGDNYQEDEDPVGTTHLMIYFFLIYFTCIVITYAVIVYLNFEIDGKRRLMALYKQYYSTELSSLRFKDSRMNVNKNKTLNATKIGNKNIGKVKTPTEKRKKLSKNNSNIGTKT